MAMKYLLLDIEEVSNGKWPRYNKETDSWGDYPAFPFKVEFPYSLNGDYLLDWVEGMATDRYTVFHTSSHGGKAAFYFKNASDAMRTKLAWQGSTDPDYFLYPF